MIRLAIADDHPIVREGLRRIVNEDPGMSVTALNRAPKSSSQITGWISETAIHQGWRQSAIRWRTVPTNASSRERCRRSNP